MSAAAGILHLPLKLDELCAAEEDGPAEELGSPSSMSAPELGEDEFVEIQVRHSCPAYKTAANVESAWQEQLLTHIFHDWQLTQQAAFSPRLAYPPTSPPGCLSHVAVRNCVQMYAL